MGEAPQITEALDKVQLAVEEKYREIREQILNFDEILNSQRRVIYNRRQEILFRSTEDNLQLIKQYNSMVVNEIVNAQTDETGAVSVDKIMEKIGQFFPPVLPVLCKDDLTGLDKEGVSNFVNVAVEEVFNSKMEEQDQISKASGKARCISKNSQLHYLSIHG